MSFEEDNDGVLSLNEITLSFGEQDYETRSGNSDPKSPSGGVMMERNGSEASLSDGSSQRSENAKTSALLRRTGSSAQGLASFLRTSKETGLLKEISKVNPSPALIEELSQRTTAEALSPTQLTFNQSVGRRGSGISVSSASSSAYKKTPLIPPSAARKVESTNHAQSSSEQVYPLGNHSASSSHTDVSSFNGDSTPRSSHEGSPVSKPPLSNGDLEVSHSGESPQRPPPPPSANRKPLPPRPKPVGRSPSNSSSEDLRQEQGELTGGSHGNRPIPKPRSISVGSTPVTVTQNESSNDRDHSSMESDLSGRGEPKVQELKYENEILKHQIMHLKDKRSELEQENLILREVLQTSGEVSPTNSPIAARRESSAAKGGATPTPSKSPLPVRGGVTPPPSKSSLPSSKSQGSSSAAKGGATPTPSKSPLPVRGGVTPPPSNSPLPNSKSQGSGSKSPAEVNEVGSSAPPTFSRINSFPSASRPTPQPRTINKSSSSSNVSQTHTQNQSGTKPKLPPKPNGITESIAEEQETNEQEPQTLPPLTTGPAKPSPVSYLPQRPIPAPRIIAESASSKPSAEGGEVRTETGKDSRQARGESGDRTATGTNKDDGKKPVRTDPDGVVRAFGVTYKKVEIKSDESWIRSRKKSEPDQSDRSRETTPASSAVSDPAQPPPRPPVPYRSVPIVASSSSSPSLSQGSTPIGAGTAYVPPSVGLDRFYTPPSFKARNISRATAHPIHRTEGGAAKRGAASPLARCNSEESLSSRSLKRTDQGAPVVRHSDAAPPKKPPRPWKRRSQSIDDWNPNSRPASMISGNSQTPPMSRTASREDFAASCTVPRTLQEEAKQTLGKHKKSPKRSRKERINPEESDKPVSPPKKRGLFGKMKGKAKTEYFAAPPPVERESDDGSDSSSEDEKGGTIKFMPKLRHVSLRKGRACSLDDDTESEYHQLFEYVFVVGLKEDPKTKALSTEMTYTFPPASGLLLSGKDAALNSIPQFCFPDIEHWKRTTVYRSETFSFVLTDMEGSRRFGYCRRLLPSGSGPRLPECYCIVSPLGCFSLYEKILDHVEERRTVSSSAVFTFLKAIVANPFPRPGRSVEVRAFSAKGHGMETVVFDRPMDSRLEHVDFSLLFTALSPRKIIQLFSSLLMERRVILCAHSLSLLSSCAHAMLALLYPFEWQHVFIPVLPNSLIDFCCSPLPYIIGIHPASIKLLDDLDMEEALVVDLDKKKFVRKIGDETSILPSKLFQYLEHSLGSSVISSEYQKPASRRPTTSRADEIVINTFMTFFVYLYGDYKLCMKTVNPVTREVEFQKKDYTKRFSSKSIRRFLEAFHMTQMFENFIEQRENPVKAQTTAQSLFEQRKISELRGRCQEIEIFSSKSRFNRWKIKKGLTKKK